LGVFVALEDSKRCNLQQVARIRSIEPAAETPLAAQRLSEFLAFTYEGRTALESDKAIFAHSNVVRSMLCFDWLAWTKVQHISLHKRRDQRLIKARNTPNLCHAGLLLGQDA